ncbi:MAG: ABC transporter substrate-binding protein, partial [Proteobacteria bacterium]|nr:ABC transporter substrate-binding protein [Pseudomonadota bacterium]
PLRFNGFPEMKEAFIAKKLNATFIIAPLAMKMREQGVPIKIVYLGHRDGTTLMVHKDSDIQAINQLEGRRIAIPSYYSNQHLILFRTFRKLGLKYDRNLLIEMPPPEMPTALAAKQVDAIIAGEPLMAKTEMEGYGRVLFMTKDVWPEFISCVLAVQEDEIKDNRAQVEALVQGIAKSGKWLDEDAANSPSKHRVIAAEAAAQKQYYNQKPELIKYVLSKPPDRVKYTNLSLQKENFEEIEALGREAGIFTSKVKFEDYADTSFVPNNATIEPWSFEVPSK